MNAKKIAIITGANRGIGFEICRQLANKGFKVMLTARDARKGEMAAQQLRSEGLDIDFAELEVGNEKSTHEFGGHMSANYMRVDVLVNNAGILLNSATIYTAGIDEIKRTFDTNFFGPIMLVQALLPLLKKSADARIINVSSQMGALNGIGGGYLAYRTSKTALNAFTAVAAKDLAGTAIKINSICPGWVRSDMGGKGAPRSLEQGADMAVWLATEPNIPTGRFFSGRREVEW